MSEPEIYDNVGTVEVHAYSEGNLVHGQLCESAPQAAAVVEAWEQLDGVECEIDDPNRECQPRTTRRPISASRYDDSDDH